MVGDIGPGLARRMRMLASPIACFKTIVSCTPQARKDRFWRDKLLLESRFRFGVSMGRFIAQDETFPQKAVDRAGHVIEVCGPTA
jgi:hypothetical protein